MVASFAAAAALRGQAWTYLLRIEGIGDYDGQHTWTINAPDFVGTADNRYLRRDTIAALPQITDERTKSMLGGMPEAGALTIELVDYADLITAARRTDAAPVATLDANISATTLTITVSDGSDLPTADFVVWIGAEAMRIDARSSNTLTVVSGGRGWLNTDARSHASGDSVYVTPPFLRTRRMTLYLAPQDADNDSVATEYVVGTYRIDRSKLGSQLGSWVLSGPTEIRDLSRLVAGRVACALRTEALITDTRILFSQVAGSSAPIDFLGIFDTIDTWPDHAGYMRNDRTSEIIRVDASTSAIDPEIVEFGAVGTERQDIKVGDIFRPVLTGDETFGSFRWSPGSTPSDDRTAGTWNISAHPVDMLLCLLTSGAHRDDGLELENYTAAGNWSSLPVGYGIGFPADRIDFGSFLAVRARTRSLALPAVILGDKDPPTFAEWATTNILEPFGWFLTTTGGLLTLIAPATILRGAAADADLDEDSIVDYSEPEESFDLVAGAVTYRHRGPGGQQFNTTLRASDFIGMFGGRAHYSVEDDPVLVDVPGVLAGGPGTDAILTSIAMRRLMRAVRAPWRITFTVDASLHALAIGNLVSVTHVDLPDLDTGVRGWTDVLGQITAASQVTLDRENRATRTLTVLVYPSFQSARIGPSAIITNVTGSGPWVCTVAANRYTSTDADDYLDLEVADCETFTVTDIVKTISRAGVDVITGYDITAIGTNTLTLNGGGAPTSGDVIVFGDYDTATASQQERYAAWCNDRGTINGDPAVRYGEA